MVFLLEKMTFLPSPFLSTPSHVKSVLINFKCPASNGNSFSAEKIIVVNTRSTQSEKYKGNGMHGFMI